MKLIFLTAAATTALFTSGAGQAASSIFGGDCDTPAGCLLHFGEFDDGRWDHDYTIPDDGVTYKVTFQFDQPGLSADLAFPNQVEFYGTMRTEAGFVDLEPRPFSFRFQQAAVSPLLNRSVYFLRGPKGIPYSCGPQTAIGDICWVNYRIWVNGVPTFFTGTDGPIDVRLSVQAVPEPAIWAIMLLGFAGVGLKIRSGSRSSRLHPRQIAT